jgi:anti-sigma regulatory factor (Ser/Thr protein kinase)
LILKEHTEASVPPVAGGSLRLLVPSDPKYGSYIRERVLGFAAARCSDDADVAEFVAAVFEAFANAVEHARSEEPIEVKCWSVRGDQLFASIVDRGVGFDAAPEVAEPPLPDPLAERGRGLPIMRRYMQLCSVRSRPGNGTAVMLGRFVRHAGRHR